MTHILVSASTTASQCLDKPHPINEDCISASGVHSAACDVRNHAIHVLPMSTYYCLLGTDYFINVKEIICALLISKA